MNSEAIVEAPTHPALFRVLAAIVLAYSLLAGLRTITDYDLPWQLATGRWIWEHSAIPDTDVFSYTASGQPWIYPIASCLLLYAIFMIGGYALLSWLGAVACVTTVALLLRRGASAAAMLAILALPRIAARTGPRAEMFTAVLFAAFLSLLWEQFSSGRARLWLLPILMVAWVNSHLGFAAGFVLIGAYVGCEVLETPLYRPASPGCFSTDEPRLAMVAPNHSRYPAQPLGLGHLYSAATAECSDGAARTVD